MCMKCKKCNSTITESSMFCAGCGTSVQELRNNNLIIDENQVSQTVGVMPNGNINQTTVPNGYMNQTTTPIGNMNQGYTYPQNNQMMNNYVYNNKKGSSKKALSIILPICAVLVLLGIGLGLFFTITKSPKFVFKKAISTMTNSITDSLDGDYDTATVSLYLQPAFDSKDSASMAAFDILNELSIDMDLEIDKKNQVINMDINSKYENEELINLDSSVQNKKMYLRFKNDQDYMYTEFDTEFTKQDDSYANLVESFSDALIDSIEKDYLSKSKQTITIDGKNIKATKNTLLLDGKTVSKMTNSIRDSLMKDEEFIEACVRITGKTKDEITSELRNITFDENTFDSKVNLSIYTKGMFNEFVKLELEGNGTSMSFVKKSDTYYVFNITSGDQSMDLLHVNISEVNGEKIYTITMEYEGEKIGIKVGYNVTYDKAITPKNVSNSVNIKYLDEQESSEFISVLFENQGLISFMTDLSELGNTYGDSSYDDDYYYDDEDGFSYSDTLTLDDVDRDNVVLPEGVTITWGE